MAKSASLTAGLVAKKGEAAPITMAPALPIAPEVAPIVTKEGAAAKDYFKALTVKLDRDRYHRLKQAGLHQDKTSQELFVEALDAYLGRDAQH